MEDVEKALDKTQTDEILILEPVQSSSPQIARFNLSKHYSLELLSRFTEI